MRIVFELQHNNNEDKSFSHCAYGYTLKDILSSLPLLHETLPGVKFRILPRIYKPGMPIIR